MACSWNYQGAKLVLGLFPNFPTVVWLKCQTIINEMEQHSFWATYAHTWWALRCCFLSSVWVSENYVVHYLNCSRLSCAPGQIGTIFGLIFYWIDGAVGSSALCNTWSCESQLIESDQLGHRGGPCSGKTTLSHASLCQGTGWWV